MSIDNKVPYLGSFPYSPMYFYVKKTNEGKIGEIFLMNPPAKFDNFLQDLKSRSSVSEQLDKIKMKP